MTTETDIEDCAARALKYETLCDKLAEALLGIYEQWDCDTISGEDSESIGFIGGDEMKTTFLDIRRCRQAIDEYNKAKEILNDEE